MLVGTSAYLFSRIKKNFKETFYFGLIFLWKTEKKTNVDGHNFLYNFYLCFLAVVSYIIP